MEIRNLITSDMFKLLKIANKMDIKKELNININKQKIATTQEELDGLGMELSFEILSRIEKAEKEIYALLGSLTNKTSKEIENQDVMITLETIEAIFKMDIFKSFFTSLTK